MRAHRRPLSVQASSWPWQQARRAHHSPSSTASRHLGRAPGPVHLTRPAAPCRCLVWDFGSRNRKRGVPRAIWYGLEFLRYAATLMWLRKPATGYLRGYNVANDWAYHVKNFSKAAKKCASAAHLLALQVLLQLVFRSHTLSPERGGARSDA